MLLWPPKFAFPVPSFEDAPNNIKTEQLEDCIYYWWYEYLKCSPSYYDCCLHMESPYTNRKPHMHEKLYKEFSNVHKLNFEEWWGNGGNQRAREIFGERGNNDEFGLIDHYDDIEPHEFQYKDELAFLRVPLKTQSKRSLKKSFSQLLDKLHAGKRGYRTIKTSQAKYKVLGKPNIPALKLHLKIYKYKLANPKVSDWKIFQIFNLYNKDNKSDFSKPNPESDFKIVMSITVQRHRKKAANLIHNVARGRFPDYEAG